MRDALSPAQGEKADAARGGGRTAGEPPTGEAAGQAAPASGMTRRAALSIGGAVVGAAGLGGAVPALAGHERRRPTPDRPPPSADLVSYEETMLAFRNHGFHLEFLDRPITPLGSHYLLIHFDIPTADGRRTTRSPSAAG